jgi:hypothetical protein
MIYFKKTKNYFYRSKVNKNVQLEIDVKKITKYKTLHIIIWSYIFRS